MILENLSFSVNESTEKDIRRHFLRCDPQFSPLLSKRVDIREYSTKIREKASTFEAWERDTLIGLVAAYMNIPEHRCFITNVSVVTDFTGKGVAARLMTACLEHAKAAEVTSILLEVSPDSRPAIQLYKKIGFQVVENRRDVLIMQCKH
jgi:ribosomal-protein-alanine N-acetyltransferase